MVISGKRESKIQGDLFYLLRELIRHNPRFDNVEFKEVEMGYPVKVGGRTLEADIVIFDKDNRAWLVIETKRLTEGGYSEKFDPNSPSVIRQASEYAIGLGAPFFATCNGEVLVLFETFKEFVPLPQRKQKSYYLRKFIPEEFAEVLLQDIVSLRLGITKWPPLDENFVERLKTLHRFISLPIFESLKKLLETDAKFRKKYSKWLDEQGFTYNEDTHNKIAIEAAYLLMNKILFYKILETKYKDLPPLSKISLLTKDALSKLKQKLDECFGTALRIDYKAVFQPGIYDEIPLPQDIIETLNEFLDEVSTYDLDKIPSDIIGRIYEGLIPKEERHRLGQYYTPPAICDLITRMCINSPDALVLDPGCGSGGFLVKSYYRILELINRKVSDEKIHQKILNQLWGIDINQFAAHLSVINLTMRNINVRSDIVNILPMDFFKVFHEQKTLKPYKGLTLDEAKGIYSLPLNFDAVVCNPPYTRQEQIGDKDYKEYIRKVALTFNGKQIEMSARAGIYVLFFTHSTHFLKEKGMMGYIVSNSWLDVEFGKDLQKFFLDNFKIHSIVEFDRRVFEEAAINTIIIILQKLTGNRNKKERDSNFVKFVRIKQPLKTEEIKNLIENAKESYEDEIAHVILKKQGELYQEEKWTKYLRAPPIFFEIIKSPKITTLKDIAKIKYPFPGKTGANEFFIISKNIVKEWGIEKKYIKPIFVSPREIKTIEAVDIENLNYVLVVNEPKNKLKGSNVLEYIKHGETKEITIKRGSEAGKTVIGYHNIPVLRNKKIWYSLGEKEVSEILFPAIMWERIFAIWNKIHATATHNFYEIEPKNKKDTILLLSFLNSTLNALFTELYGRTPLGAGALEIMVYEVENLPILNPAKLSQKEKEKIEKAFIKLCNVQKKNNKNLEKEARNELDNAIFDVLELNDGERQQVIDGLNHLREMRKRRKEPEVLIEHPESVKIPKQKRIKEFKKSEKISLKKWFGS
ncbi:MAG: N-6 DNA methylase [Candidatus Omnitrophica bacterium]|nr:N-6 DNA methylase [Candidatus Omnitrophota bacterium]